MTTHSHVVDLLPAYALDCLDDDEARLVAEHLAECRDCQAEFAAFEAVAQELPLAAPDAAPSAELKQQLLERTQPPATSSASKPSVPQRKQGDWWLQRPRTIPLWQVVGVLLIILVLLGGNLLLWQRSQGQGTGEPGKMIALRLANPGAMPQANGFILISADGLSGAVVVDELPMLDSTQQYQLWLVQDEARVSGAVFSVDELGYGGAGILPPQSLFEYTKAEITIEPSEGSPAPTGEVVLQAPLFN